MEYKSTYYGDAYCVKCKEKREMVGEIRTSDSGRRMATGKCGVCGTKMNRILGKEPYQEPPIKMPQPAPVAVSLPPEPYAVITLQFEDGMWHAHVADKHLGRRDFKNFTRKRVIRKAMQWINSYQVIKLTEGRRNG